MTLNGVRNSVVYQLKTAGLTAAQAVAVINTIDEATPEATIEVASEQIAALARVYISSVGRSNPVEVAK